MSVKWIFYGPKKTWFFSKEKELQEIRKGWWWANTCHQIKKLQDKQQKAPFKGMWIHLHKIFVRLEFNIVCKLIMPPRQSFASSCTFLLRAFCVMNKRSVNPAFFESILKNWIEIWKNGVLPILCNHWKPVHKSCQILTRVRIWCVMSFHNQIKHILAQERNASKFLERHFLSFSAWTSVHFQTKHHANLCTPQKPTDQWFSMNLAK